MSRTLAHVVLCLTLVVPTPLAAQRVRPSAVTAARSDIQPTVETASKPPSRVRYAVVGAVAGIAITGVLIAKFGGEGGPGSAFAAIPVVLGAGVLGALAGLIVHAARY